MGVGWVANLPVRDSVCLLEFESDCIAGEQAVKEGLSNLLIGIFVVPGGVIESAKQTLTAAPLLCPIR